MKLSGAIYNGKAEIKNIIFDWGGVLTDLHFDATKESFRQLGLQLFDEWVPNNPHDDLFIPFETGLISPDEFRNRLRKFSAHALSDEMIDNAWNAMLGEFPAERWHLLEAARNYFRTFLLSNTNAIHLPYYSGYLKKIYGTNGYLHLFERTFFSHVLGMRKPNADIFEHVLRECRLVPRETLFIDDFAENIETARSMGIQTFHLIKPYKLTDLFDDQKS
jgi:putative hydrolase of the HAD superfamily